MTLIHVALYPEAKPIIEFFQLKQIQTQPYKIYKNDNVVLVVGGIGKEKTLISLEDIFKRYSFTQAINIGIAGCKDENIPIGTFFSINRELKGAFNGTITTVDEPIDNKEKLHTLLVDMECEYFKKIVTKYLVNNNIYIFKIVSDHLNKAIPKKSFVNMLVNDTLGVWCKLI